MANPLSSTSTFAEIVQNDLPLPTQSDFASWNILTSPVPYNGTAIYTADDYQVTLGLCGADLTAFKTDCAVSTLCNPADWLDYDGWALGATINFPMKLGEPDNGFCIKNICTLGYYGARGGPRVYTKDMTQYGGVSEDSPDHASFTSSPELEDNYGFNTWGAWSYKLQKDLPSGSTVTSIAWRFVPYGESQTWQRNAKVDIWAVIDAPYKALPPPVVVPDVPAATESTNATASTDATASTNASASAEAPAAARRLLRSDSFNSGNILNADFVLKSSITLAASSLAMGLSLFALQ